MSRVRPVLAIVAALLASGAVAAAPHSHAATPPPGPTVSLGDAVVGGEGFDMCQAPPSSTMRAWLASPMRAVNIYFAGGQRACADQPYLSAEWVRTVTANGWSIIPTDVDRQPPCYGGSKARISRTPSVAQQQGKEAADTAIDLPATGLTALGIPRHSPAYIDIENFPAGHPACDTAVRRFLLGWIDELRARGYRAGVYGLPTGAIRVLVSSRKANPSYPLPDAIWFARYDGVDSTWSADIPSTYLPNHRIKQYVGGRQPNGSYYTETHAGITWNIDKDAMRGDVVRMRTLTTPSGAPYAYAIAGDPGSGVHIRTAPNTSSASVLTVTDGYALSIACQTVGETVHGDYVWDKLSNGTYVHDLYTNTTGGNGVSQAIPHCETTPPTVSVTPLPVTTLHWSTTLSYSATDASGVSSYDVRWRKASDRGGFGSWQYPRAWQHTRSKQQTLGTLALGGTYCLQVRAYDRLTNVSRWSKETCVARPLDDTALTVGSRWHRHKDSAFYMSTYTLTKTLRAVATRTGEQMYRVGIVATRCANCGKVRLLIGGQSVGVIDLTAPSPQRRRTLLLPVFSSLRTGTVTVRVITNGKTVQLDGLVVSRR